MRDSAAAARGTEIDAQGDSFFFSFTRARDAVACAVAAQRRLATETWPERVEVRVRMGLHTGEPSLGEEGYLGLDVVRGARIAAAAHGGQILVSETTRALLPAELPDGATIVDLGEHRLKGLERPERLFQLVAPGMQAKFERPRSEAPALNRREDELTRKINDYVDRKLATALESVDVDHEARRVGGWLRGLRRRRR